MAAPDVFEKKLLTANIKWKGAYYQQLVSGIKLNKPTYGAKIAPTLLRRALPLKIYRREIASTSTKCNPRTSMLYQFDAPGQTIVTAFSTNNGLATTLDFKYENNKCQHPTRPLSNDPTCNPYLSQQNNARRRVRSAGMMRSKYDVNANNDTYYQDTNQYLTSRNRSFKQNQYFHIRQGDTTVIPGSATSYYNIYTSNGISHCPKFNLTYAITISYKWLSNGSDSNSQTTANYNIVIPIGSYDITDFNKVIQNAMYSNGHYLYSVGSKSYVYFMNFVYNSAYNRIELDSYILPDVSQIGGTYNYPVVKPYAWVLLNSSYRFNPSITFTNVPFFTSGLGFSAGTYPATTSGNTSTQAVLGTSAPSIQPNYVPIYYKPSNYQFAKQGAVSSSDLITRKRYDTITKAANTMRTAYGNQTADALAYGVPTYGYTLKDRIGYKYIKIPTLNKLTGKMDKCCVIKRGMRNLRNG